MSWWNPTVSAVAVALSATLAIWGHTPSRMRVHRFFKPVTIVIIIVTTMTLADTPDRAYVAWLRAGLLLSLLGDVFLMIDDQWFSRGLVAFLFALVTYAIALGRAAALNWHLAAYVVCPLLPALGILAWLWPRLGKYRPAVVIYVAAMTAMVLMAIARAATPGVSFLSGLAGIAGALLFMTSDTLVARRRFAEPAAPYAVELGAYFAAQWLLIATTWTG